MHETITTPETTGRDAKVDPIGFVKELQKGYSDDLISDVKSRMMEKGLKRVQGDLFEGVLATGETSSIDPDLFLGMLEAKKLTREQFVACISVGNEAARRYFSGEQIAAMSTKSPRPPALYVNRIKGVETRLLESLDRLGAQALSKLSLALRGR